MLDEREVELEEELERCPFCGTEDIDKRDGLELHYDYGVAGGHEFDHRYNVICHNCWVKQFVSYETPEEAVAAWNKRAGDAN